MIAGLERRHYPARRNAPMSQSIEANEISARSKNGNQKRAEEPEQ
jgi:hypothetical protein